MFTVFISRLVILFVTVHRKTNLPVNLHRDDKYSDSEWTNKHYFMWVVGQTLGLFTSSPHQHTTDQLYWCYTYTYTTRKLEQRRRGQSSSHYQPQCFVLMTIKNWKMARMHLGKKWNWFSTYFSYFELIMTLQVMSQQVYWWNGWLF